MSTAIAETEEILRRLAPSGKSPLLRQPLVEDECRWFNLALAEGLFRFSSCGEDCFRRKKWKNSGPDHFEPRPGAPRHLYSKPGFEPDQLNREYIPHIAAFARAILAYGYDRRGAGFSQYRSFSADRRWKKKGQSYETDAEFRDVAGGLYLQIEAKTKPGEVERMSAQLAASGRVPGAILPKEVEYVLELQPRHLWLVGPGTIEPAAHVFKVAVDGHTALFTRLADLPPPPP